jgi:hypothetical protein
MSVLTTLALMTGAVVAKLRPVNADVEITRLQAKLDELNSKLSDFERDLAISRLQADRWRALVERYQGREEQQRPAGPDFRAHQEMRERLQAHYQAQQLMAMAQAQQMNMNAQQAQHHQGLAQQNYFQGNLGAQAQTTLEWCNCVPARHDMFLPR